MTYTDSVVNETTWRTLEKTVEIFSTWLKEHETRLKDDKSLFVKHTNDEKHSNNSLKEKKTTQYWKWNPTHKNENYEELEITKQKKYQNNHINKTKNYLNHWINVQDQLGTTIT